MSIKLKALNDIILVKNDPRDMVKIIDISLKTYSRMM
jgi:cation transport ATPase